MHARKMFRIVFAGFVLAGIGVVVSAQAAISAAAGSASNAGDSGCFVRISDRGITTGQVTNTCADQRRRWCVSDFIATSGSKSVVVNGFLAPGSTGMPCTASAIDKSGSIVSSSTRTLSTFGSNVDLPVGSVSVPPYGALTVCCDMPPSSRLNTINY
jgi:hypothetical protein